MKKYKKLLSTYNEVVKAKKEEENKKVESDWRDTKFTDEEKINLYHKTMLMYDMTRWVKHYNQTEGFVPDWEDSRQIKHGIRLDSKKVFVENFSSLNSFIFGLSVKSEERAEQMLKEFGERIEKYY